MKPGRRKPRSNTSRARRAAGPAIDRNALRRELARRIAAWAEGYTCCRLEGCRRNKRCLMVENCRAASDEPLTDEEAAGVRERIAELRAYAGDPPDHGPAR